MEVESFQNVVDVIGVLALFVDPIERVARGLDRQCRDVEPLAPRRDNGKPGGNEKRNVVELAQLFHCRIDVSTVCSLWVEYRFGVIEDDQHLLGGQELAEGGQTLGILVACTDDTRELTEERSERGGELVTADESTIFAEPLFDPIVVEHREGN